MTIGEKMKQVRKDRGLTQEQLAENLIVSRAAVAKWENDNGVPDIDNLKKISQLFGVSIDELVDNSVINDTKQNDSSEEYYATYIGKKCNVEMTDWNDGVLDAYILNQDEKFVYYVTIQQKCKKFGALAKQYIEKITVCSKKEKQVAEICDFTEIKRSYFINKTTNIYLEDKHFFSGILGEDTEMLDVGIVEINNDYVKLASGLHIEIKRITKIESENFI